MSRALKGLLAARCGQVVRAKHWLETSVRSNLAIPTRGERHRQRGDVSFNLAVEMTTTEWWGKSFSRAAVKPF
ncbi:hypothetical protein BS50DRAFT_567500 [Corynespora cassiicola Philippines]|uniref:Uncharacterized protein n=1 Tax=Corynespora cassiicola Philippines TaxID=1448308 RepID=A0A2T2PAN5_CORCC|nr:hypothetical protein BS50DRAFT_567500 [Corynespora cassiicola Philippines]